MADVVTVMQVLNGNTFETFVHEECIKLAGVEVPDIDTRLGKAATRELENLINEKTVRIEKIAQDETGLMIANVWRLGRSVNDSMRDFLEH